MYGFTSKERLKILEEASRVRETLQEARSCASSKKKKIKIKGYSKKEMKEKAKKDAVFFEHLLNEIIKTNSKKFREVYENLVAEALATANKILEEADVAPRTISPVVDNDILTEEEMIQYYKHSFNLILEQKFNKPNVKSQLLFEDDGQCDVKRVLAPGVKGIIIKCVKNGILDQNDPEAVIKYLKAEDAIKSAISNTIIPQRIFDQIEQYREQLPEGYTDIFGNTLQEKIEQFKQTVAKLAALVAPFIFIKALKDAGVDVQFDPSTLAGVSLENQTEETN